LVCMQYMKKNVYKKSVRIEPVNYAKILSILEVTPKTSITRWVNDVLEKEANRIILEIFIQRIGSSSVEKVLAKLDQISNEGKEYAYKYMKK